MTVDDLLQRVVEDAWQGLTSEMDAASREAAHNLAERAPSVTGVFEVSGADFRSVHVEQSGSEPLEFDGPIEALVPGYSTDGRVALVRIHIPWSIHGVFATYVLSERDGVWTILVRQFAYYV